LRLIVGILILFYLLYFVGFKKIYESLVIFNYRLLPLILVFFFLFMIISVYNVKILINPIKRVSFNEVMKYFFVGWTYSLFLPLKVGEFSLAYFLKYKVGMGKTCAAVLMDKVITFFFTFIIAIIGVCVIFNGFIALKVLLLFLVLFVMFIFIMSEKARLFIRKYVLKKYSKRLKGFSSTFFSYFKENKRYLFLNSFLTLIKIGVTAIFGYFIFLSLGLRINPLIIAFVSSLEILSVFIPLTVNGLGIKQGIGLYAYSLIGVGSSIVAARYVIGLIIRYGFGLLVMLFVKVGK